MATKTRVKGRQIERYYRLLVRLGMDRLLDTVQPKPTPPSGRITSASEQLATVDVDAVEEAITVDLGMVLRACAGADESADLSAVAELAAAVLDLDDETAGAGDWFMDDVEEAWPGFTSACAAPLRMLLSGGGALGSGQAAPAETETPSAST